MNGNFANIGEKPTAEQFEHGIQVINEDQEFKFELLSSNLETHS